MSDPTGKPEREPRAPTGPLEPLEPLPQSGSVTAAVATDRRERADRPGRAAQARRAARLRWRQWVSRGPEAPAVPSAPAGALAAKAAFLRRLELDVTRRLDGIVTGDYLTIGAGPGTEPAGARAYGPGDDARRIDWSLTARALTPHVRTTEADRELETWVVVDRSASLDFGTTQREKREVALAVVAAFGFLNSRAGNRLGVLVAGGDRISRLPARSGRTAVLAALSLLYDTPRRQSGPAPSADLSAALAQVERTQRRRGQVIVISDFLDSADWAPAIRRLALRHQVVAAQVTDPREFDIPAVGLLELVDAESGTRLSVQTNSAGLRQRYAAAVAERQDRIRRLLAEAGAEHLELSTDRDWLVDVARFIGRRRNIGPVSHAARFGGRYRGAMTALTPTPAPARPPARPPSATSAAAATAAAAASSAAAATSAAAASSAAAPAAAAAAASGPSAWATGPARPAPFSSGTVFPGGRQP